MTDHNSTKYNSISYSDSNDEKIRDIRILKNINYVYLGLFVLVAVLDNLTTILDKAPLTPGVIRTNITLVLCLIHLFLIRKKLFKLVKISIAFLLPYFIVIFPATMGTPID